MKHLIKFLFVKPLFTFVLSELGQAALIGGLISAGSAGSSAVVSGRMNKKTRELAKKQFEKNYAQVEKWNNISQQNYENATQIRVRDMQAAGINPLAASGSDSGATITGGTSSTASTSTNNQNPVDFSQLAQVVSDYADRKILKEKYDSDYSLAKTKQENDYDIADRELALREKEFEEKKRSNLAQEGLTALSLQQQKEFNDKLVAQKYAELSEERRKNLQSEYLRELGLSEDVAKRLQEDEHFNRQMDIRMSELENATRALDQEDTKIANEKEKADKDRRQRYVDTIVNGINDFIGNKVKALGSILGAAGKVLGK